MGLQKKESSVLKLQHEWERDWGRNDYQSHAIELKQIFDDWEKAKQQSRENGKLAEYCYQMSHGGMTQDLAVHIDETKLANGEAQIFDINSWKLRKCWKWKEFSMTPDERAQVTKREKEISVEITNKLSKFRIKHD